MAQRVVRQTASGGDFIQMAARRGRAGLPRLLVVRSCSSIHPYTCLSMVYRGSVPAVQLASRWHLGDRPEARGRDHYGISLAIVIGPVTWLGSAGRWLQELLASLAGHPGYSVTRLMASRNMAGRAPGFTSSGNQASTKLRAALRSLLRTSSHWLVRCLPLPPALSLGNAQFVASVVLSGFLFHYGPPRAA